MSKLQSILNWLERKSLTLEEIESIEQIINEKRYQLLSKRFSDGLDDDNEEEEHKYEPDEARIAWFDEFDNLQRQEVLRQTEPLRLNLKSTAVMFGIEAVIESAIKEYSKILEDNLSFRSELLLFFDTLKIDRDRWEQRHWQYFDEVNDLIEKGYASDPIVYVQLAFASALVSLQEQAERNIKPYLEYGPRAETGETQIMGRAYDVLQLITQAARFITLYQLEINAIDNIRANSSDPQFACWSIMTELQNPNRELSISTVQRLNTDWIRDNLEGSPTHETLHEGLKVANQSFSSGKSLAAFVSSTEGPQYSESYVKRYRQWFRRIDEHKGEFVDHLAKRAAEK